MKGTQNSLFPGNPPDSISVRIADITCEIVSLEPTLRLQTQQTHQDFTTPKAAPDITIGARWDDLLEPLGAEKVFDSEGLWRLYECRGNYLYSFISDYFGAIPYKMFLVKKDYSYGEVLLHRSYFDPEQPVTPLEFPLDEVLFTNFLALGRGAEIHSCGLVDPSGKGYLFVGQSTAGKTTMARLWEDEPRVTVLSDDRIILRKMENKIWMYGTPWHGEAMLASPHRAPLTRIYFLEKGQSNKIIPQKPLDAIPRLFSCSFPPFHNRDAVDFTLAFLDEVVKSIPCYALKFTPTKSIVEFIKEGHYI